MLYVIDDQEDVDGVLSSGAVLRVQLGDGCVVDMHGMFFTVLH
jgi:hypothetical protein